jgi:hypothetical protein
VTTEVVVIDIVFPATAGTAAVATAGSVAAVMATVAEQPEQSGLGVSTAKGGQGEGQSPQAQQPDELAIHASLLRFP